MEQPVQTDLLQDIQQEIYFQPASTGVRFVNYLIDAFVFYAFFFLIVFLIVIAALKSESDVESGGFEQSTETGTGLILQYLVYLILYIGMYTILEGASKGKTLGKLITRSRAVRRDGTPITWGDAFKRSLCRLVPFEPFSAFGIPWHDKWTNTVVKKES